MIDEQTRHPMLPDQTHDELARENFARSMKKVIFNHLTPGVRDVWEHRVGPAFEAAEGRGPADRHEVRKVMMQDPYVKMWCSLRRVSQELLWDAVSENVERQADDLVERAKAMEGGWLNTGDLGVIDEDGRVAYRGRFKDMLKVGGENVSALEIEAYLGTHPKVKVVAVASVPDEKYTEVPAAFVEIVPGEALTEEELIAYCKDQIANFKIPRYVRFVTEWPMSATKIQKFKLRADLLAELGLE